MVSSVIPGPKLLARVAQGEDMYRSVSASQLHTQSVTQLHYGPSSNFAFLQHIHNCMAQPREPRSVDNSDAEGSSHDLDYFKQREQFFGATPKRYQPEATRNVLKNFLPVELAQSFLENFQSSIYQLVPFYNSDQLHHMLKQLYGLNEDPLPTARRAIILAILAIGSTMSTDTRWSMDLYEQAKKEAFFLEDIVNCEAVQVITLLINPLIVQVLQPHADIDGSDTRIIKPLMDIQILHTCS
jgi:hypothetical protein